MKLTFEGLIRALRFKLLTQQENIAIGRTGARSEVNDSSGDQNEKWRGSIAESTL